MCFTEIFSYYYCCKIHCPKDMLYWVLLVDFWCILFWNKSADSSQFNISESIVRNTFSFEVVQLHKWLYWQGHTQLLQCCSPTKVSVWGLRPVISSKRSSGDLCELFVPNFLPVVMDLFCYKRSDWSIPDTPFLQLPRRH